MTVDDFLVERMNLTRRWHQARVHKQPVLKPDKPWEKGKGTTARPFTDALALAQGCVRAHGMTDELFGKLYGNRAEAYLQLGRWEAMLQMVPETLSGGDDASVEGADFGIFFDFSSMYQKDPNLFSGDETPDRMALRAQRRRQRFTRSSPRAYTPTATKPTAVTIACSSLYPTSAHG